MSTPRPTEMKLDTCDGCGWSAQDVKLELVEIEFGTTSSGDGHLTYWLELCHNCHLWYKRTGTSPKWRPLRADQGMLAVRINNLRKTIARLEAKLKARPFRKRPGPPRAPRKRGRRRKK